MASVDPGELKYRITIKNIRRQKDANDHYLAMPEIVQARAGILKGSGGNKLEDGAARAVDSITFIVRWEVRTLVQRDASIQFKGAEYDVDWMDSVPWAERYARIRAVSRDEGAR